MNSSNIENLSEIIKKRKSCRTYNQEHLRSSHKQSLEDFINSTCKSTYLSLSEKADNSIASNLFILEKTGE